MPMKVEVDENAPYWAKALNRATVRYRCGGCLNKSKPCHNCRCCTWRANGYVPVWPRDKWLSAQKDLMKDRLLHGSEASLGSHLF